MPGETATVDHELRHAAAERGDSPFLVCDDTTLTYGDLEAQTARVANGLSALGVSQGEHVALLSRNSPEFGLTWLGANRAGMPVVPVNAGLRGDGLARIIDHSDAVVAVVEEEFLPDLLAVRDSLPQLREVVVVGSSVPDGAIPWSRIANGDAGAPEAHTKSTDTMMLMYTSGTTGLPKGVVLPQTRIMGGRTLLGWAGITPEDVLYTCLPLFHANAAIISFWGAFGLGTKLVLSRRFSASRIWDELRVGGATAFNSLGAMMSIIYKQPERPDDADNPVRLVLSAACPKEIWEPFEARFGCDIVEFYGTVEGGLTMAGPDAPVGSIGKAVGGPIKILRDDGSECAPGEVGDLVAQAANGQSATVCYYKDEEASARKTEGGWLRTGDRAYADAEGWLWFVDRGAHFMRRRGENISSTEVEQVVEAHPAVLECAAYGLPSELGEDEVTVAVVAKAGEVIDPQELHAFCRDHMASFQVPRFVRVMEALPKTETHRAQKVGLREEGRTADLWDAEASTA